MAKVNKPDWVTAESVDADSESKIKQILESSNSSMSYEDALGKVEVALNSPYCKRSIEGNSAKINYALNTLRKHVVQQSRVVTSKPTIKVSMVLRNLGALERNFVNETEETRQYNDPNLKRGIAGSWYKCNSCLRMFNSEDTGRTTCPACMSDNTFIVAQQAVPDGTIGVVNRKLMTKGDISQFNTRQAAAFALDEESGEWMPSFIKFTGKARGLLNKVVLGKPFDITVDANTFTKEENGVVYYSTTGVSAINNFKGAVPDMISLYERYNEGLIKDISDITDNDYCAMILQVLAEPTRPKEDGKWLIQLAPLSAADEEDEGAEPVILYAFFDSQKIASQLHEGDAGIFEVRYTENDVTRDGAIEKDRFVNIEVTPSGVPIYLFGEDGTTRLIRL